MSEVLHGYTVTVRGRGIAKRCRKESSIWTEISGLLLPEPVVSDDLFAKAKAWLAENYKVVHKAEIHLSETFAENMEGGGSVRRIPWRSKEYVWDVETREQVSKPEGLSVRDIIQEEGSVK